MGREGIQGSRLGSSHEIQCPILWLVMTGDLRMVVEQQAQGAAILYWNKRVEALGR